MLTSATLKYDIPELSKLACRKFSIRVAEQWSTAGFAKAIAELYTGPDHGKEEMRSTAVATAAKHAKELFEMESAIDFRNMASSVPQFAAELCAAIAEDAAGPRVSRYRCPNICCKFVVSMETVSGPGPGRSCYYCAKYFGCDSWINNLVRGD